MQGKILKTNTEPGVETALLRSEIFRAWWQATKPGYFVAVLVPLVLAFIAAGKYRGMWEGLVFSGALLVAFALHVNANLCYHLFGEEKDRIFAGSGPRLKEVFTAKSILQVVGGLYALALLLTCLAVWMTGLNALLFFVLFAMFSSFYYVTPPISFSRQGMGEIIFFLNLGIIAVSGTYYALTREFPLQPLALAIPVGAMAAMIVFHQNIINIKADKLTGKKTPATLLGAEKSAFLFTMAWPGIWLLMVMLWFSGLCSWQILFGIFFSFPFYMKLVLDLDHPESPDSGHGVSGYFTYLMYLVCGISLIVAVAYTVPPKYGVQTPAPVEMQKPVEAQKPVETQKPVEAQKPVETPTPVEKEAPAEKKAPVEVPVETAP